ncbi:hypothetical protein [Actinacidiphila sp. ITFR-21]|uniref:hypothetical protein n=1 Tax=Actinacidiphila sp. ITFR-21 TaxID=3075199 RepID=UPI00288983DC|nr:hypothetical protein [Streptomyces sp. ITFR-21]WNI18817.1 hypothetical protein RLT57_27000 [Streptomyces sp. ITFR-21]
MTTARQLSLTAATASYPAGSAGQASVLLFNAQHASPERSRRQAADFRRSR